LQITDLQVPANPVSSGGTFDVSWTVTNAGSRDTRQGSWLDAFYLSRDPSLDNSDIALGGLGHGQILKTGDSYTATLQLTLPENISGDFYIVGFTDAHGFDNSSGAVQEFQGEGNNITSKPLKVVLKSPPDLQVRALDVPQHAIAGQAFTVNYTVTNNGSSDTP